MNKKYFKNVILILILLMSITITVVASDDNDTDNRKEMLVQNPDIKYLPTSLGIKIKNIDLESFDQSIDNPNPLDAHKIYNLKEKGYSEEDISNMNCGDYDELEKNWKLLDSQILTAKRTYQELTEVDMSNWSNNDLAEFERNARYHLTDDEATKFKERNITQADAYYLLQEFQDYTTILEQPDDVLKKCLIEYYERKNEYVEHMMSIAKSDITIVEAEPIVVQFSEQIEIHEDVAELTVYEDIVELTPVNENTVQVSLIYIVKKGDMLHRIARKFETDCETLVELNSLKNPDLIYPGQELKISDTLNTTVTLTID